MAHVENRKLRWDCSGLPCSAIRCAGDRAQYTASRMRSKQDPTLILVMSGASSL